MKNDRGYALITGASQGLGAALTMELARNGFGVLLVARSEEAMRQVAAEAGALNGDRTGILVSDLFAPGAMDRLVALAYA